VSLLFDANLSPALVWHLRAQYPGSTHVRDVGLQTGSDAQIVWLDVGNAGTMQIAALLEKERLRVERFGKSPDVSVLILSLGASAI